MTGYLHSGANKMNKVGAYINDNKLLLADRLGHAKVSSLKEQNLINTINTVATHDTDITQLKTDMNKVRGAYVYKGTVETEFDLPLNNNSVGDVYNVSLTGMNYAWNGENWDELGYNNLETKLKTWTTEQIGRATSFCEERLRFNPVPVYSVTLAENTAATISSPYTIDVSNANSKNLMIFIEPTPGNNVKYCTYTVICSDNTVASYYTQTVDTANRFVNVYTKIENGVITIGGRASSTLNNVSSIGSRVTNVLPVITQNAYISTVQLAITSGEPLVFPSGTKITVYAASPDQRITDVFGTELEEVTSEQIHSLFV